MNRLSLFAGLLIPGAAMAQGAPAPAQPEAAPQEQQAQQPEQPAQPQQTATVEVTERGAEPRKELRYRPTIGQVERIELSMNIALTTTMDGQEGPPMELPTVTTIWLQTPRQITGDGKIQYDIDYESVKVDPSDPSAAQLEQFFAPLTHVTGIGEMTERGEQVRLDLSAPADAHDAAASQIDTMRMQMRNLGVIFPQEAIGEGAAWVVTMPVDIDGVQVEQKTTYTLQSSDDETVRLAMAVDQTAPQQKLSPPGMPPESASVERFSGTGEGEIRLEPGRLVPAQSTQSGSITVDLRIEVGPEVREVTQRMESRVQATSRAADEGEGEEGDEGAAGEQPAPAPAPGGNAPGGGN
jgi:hypothetical protein